MTAKRARQKQKRRWDTTPALISAVATLIIAITGVIAIIYGPTPPIPTPPIPTPPIPTPPIPTPPIPTPPIYQEDEENLLRNGGFEEDLKFWGTGYHETDRFKGSLGTFWASRVGMDIEKMKIAGLRGDIDSEIRKSGVKSFKITNNAPSEAHIYGSMSQRITGLMENTDYIASFWVKAERAGRGTFVNTIDLKWLKRKYIEAGTYNWHEFSWVFNTGNSTFIDFRIISEEPGTVWVDDIKLMRVFPAK